jgi:hypothetical protein
LFVQLAEGVDEATFDYHLRRHDYSTWLATAVKDADLAREVHELECREPGSSAEARSVIRSAISRRYTLPA